MSEEQSDWILFGGATDQEIGSQPVGVFTNTRIPVLLFYGDRTLIGMNQAAAGLLNERQAFRVNNNSFSLVRAEDAASLSETLLRLEKGGAHGTLGVCVSITCPDSGELFVMRLHPAKAAKNHTIFLASIDGESAFSWSLSPEVRRAYRLTAAELRIATLFFEGHDPVEIAGELKLSEHTVRTHLRNIYAKCGVRGQAELMKKLCRFAM